MEDSPEQPSALEHLKESWLHAENVIRAYLDAAATEFHKRLSRIVAGILWQALLALLAVIGVVIVAVGLASYLSDRLAVAGAGQMIVGAALLIIASLILLVRWMAERGE